MISDSLWWNWGGRGRVARFGEDEVIIHTPEWSGQRKSLTLSQFMEDGTIMFSYLLAKRLSFSFPFVFLSMGGIPARNSKGERLLLYIGIIDILQSYR